MCKKIAIAFLMLLSLSPPSLQKLPLSPKSNEAAEIQASILPDPTCILGK